MITLVVTLIVTRVKMAAVRLYFSLHNALPLLSHSLSYSYSILTMYEMLPCIVETVTNQVVTYESLRGLSEVIKAREEELVKTGIDKKYIEDFIEDIETLQGPICGSEDRVIAYIEILNEIDF